MEQPQDNRRDRECKEGWTRVALIMMGVSTLVALILVLLMELRAKPGQLRPGGNTKPEDIPDLDRLSIHPAYTTIRREHNVTTISTPHLTTKDPELSSEPQTEKKCQSRAWRSSIGQVTSALRSALEAQTQRTHLMSSNDLKPVVQVPVQVSASRVQTIWKNQPPRPPLP